MEILFTRHGETNWNAMGKVQGKVDIELNEKGLEQAEITRKLLENEKIDLIICSTLKRARQTAEIINRERNIPIIYDNGIVERDFGEYEGMNVKSFDFEGCWDIENDYKYQKTEKMKDFFSRVYKFLDRIKDDYNNKRILVVAHGGVNIPVYCYFNGIPENKRLRSLILNNCEVVKYQYK